MAFLSFPSPTQLRNLSDPASNQDAATKAYVDTSLSGGTGTISVGNVAATGNITATGNVTANNANLGNTVNANYFVGSGSQLTDIAGSTITGTVGNATHANYADVANSVAGSNVVGQVGNAATLNGFSSTSFATSAQGSKADSAVQSGANISIFINDSGYLKPADLTSYAKQADISNAVANLVASAPAALDTLNELANALGNDASYSTTINNALANKLSTTNFNSTANTWISTQSTSNLSEGTNLYYTNTRANSAIDARVTKTFVDALAVVANVSNVALSIAGANVTGTVANANYAAYASNITTAAQPNITSVGTLTSLTVSGVSTLGNIANVKITGGTANYVLSTDGTGNLAWSAPGGAGSLTADVDNFTGDGANTAFTLSKAPAGSNYTIVAVQGVLQPKSSYTVSDSTLTFSSAPPNTAIIEVTTFGGQVVSGSGGTGPSFTWNVASSNATMSVNNGYFIDTSTAAKTMTLPTTATLGDTIRINDLAGTFDSHNLTISRNGHKIQGVADDLLVDYAQASATLVYSNSTYGWKVLES